MAPTADPITTKEEFEAAIAEPVKYVFIYVHEGEISEELKEKFRLHAPKFEDKVAHRRLNVSDTPVDARGDINVEKLPVLVVFKEGKQIERVEPPSEENMGALAWKLFA